MLLLVEATLSLQEAKECQMVGLMLEMKDYEAMIALLKARSQ